MARRRDVKRIILSFLQIISRKRKDFFMSKNDKDELICICNSVSYRRIEEAVEQGAKNYEDILEMTGAGGVCGGCIERVDDILRSLVVQ